MSFEIIDRPQRKRDAAQLLSSAAVNPKAMTALYMALVLCLNLLASIAPAGFPSIFISILANLLIYVLGAGFVLYCMAVRRGERSEFLTLFDGFSFAGKIILLQILIAFFVFLWSMLFIIPGIIAAYRYSFAIFNLYENPGITPLEAIDMSKRQTLGYKSQLFTLKLSYLPWGFLASFPSTILLQLIARDTTNFLLFGTPAPTSYFGLPILLLDLLCGIWQLAVVLFYYPNYTCVQLSYFETAKQTSGVGLGASQHDNSSPWDGWFPPDGLG